MIDSVSYNEWLHQLACAELRGLISRRTKKALAYARASGIRLGRPSTMPDAVRERIDAERAAGRSLPAIAAGLNADGVQTAQGGRQWYPSTVRAVLHRVGGPS